MLRRLVPLIALCGLVLPALTACGEVTPALDTKTETGSVEVSGPFGKEPKVTYDGRVVRTETETTVLHEGKGPKLTENDSVFVNEYVGNGWQQVETESTWDDQRREWIYLGQNAPTPAVREALVGARVGSRIQVVAAPDDWGGYGNPELFIGSDDTTIWVIDVVRKVPKKVSGKATQPPGMPTVVEKGGKVTGLDFSGAPKQAPEGLRVETLIEGSGKPIQKGSQVALRYLGQVWGKKKSFDSNWEGPAPGMRDQQSGMYELTQLGVGQVVPGWDQGLMGVREGSRVLLTVPPDLGYGEQGTPDGSVKKDDTMVFVIDVLGVA